MSETILPGAEPFLFDGSRTGVLLSHGFTGTTQSMRPLGEHLAQAGYTVSAPRLAGHGTSPADMATTGARDWVASIDTALADLRTRCDTIFMAGLSMGGTLTLLTAARHADVIRGIIPINAVVRQGSPERAMLAFGSDPALMLPGIGSDIKAPNVRELAYPETPGRCLAELYMLTGVTHDLLGRITCPTLVLQSRDDHVVDPSNARLIAGALGAGRVELRWLEDSYHVATLDHDAPLIAEWSLQFIASIK
ncbi:alpha/beta hydrolase [Lichenicoccus sp.]|uniref:alpha/beta hydrolase n=1 Tax=Lichenicoccus sp. TaxID=2781899 RepID=UPI003D10DA1B